MKRLLRKALLRFLWMLEDIADFITFGNADGFYPSGRFERFD